ncbi:protein WHAT'S THIS FACTOR 1 homolog, chloroplastic [Magnolia sinica]|uniref:protein WHAT'S THIS FACTOR 1 homolog, chloroplastic n=1 Tax=Magnolia sinica TaxID=86752 RepID=UPI00265A264C|nr:protein WHAT'S THIS FACTOR 1 homolog, chloroplastic [Magnolia sinica]
MVKLQCGDFEPLDNDNILLGELQKPHCGLDCLKISEFVRLQNHPRKNKIPKKPMAWRLLLSSKKPQKPLQKPFISFFSSSHFENPNPNSSSFPLCPPINKKRKPPKKPRKRKDSPRTKLVQHESQRIQAFERIVQRDTLFRFITRTKSFLSNQPDHILLLDEAGKLHRELGFPRGRKVARSIERHPSLLQLYRHTDGKIWLGFTDLMEDLLQEENSIMDVLEQSRVTTVRKLLMMSSKHRIPLSKIHHCRHLFGIPDDFRDRALKYPDYFRVAIDSGGTRVLELVEWDPFLAVSALERDFVLDEDRVKRTFKFEVAHRKSLNLDDGDKRRLDEVSTLPLVSPYSEGSDLKLWSVEAEKYRVGVLHEFLSLTLEKRASIHHIVEFKEEFSLTKHTYQMLMKQPRAFYLAGTEMNWTVFLRDAYGNDGVLKVKDPQVVFNEKMYRLANMKGMGSDIDIEDCG